MKRLSEYIIEQGNVSVTKQNYGEFLKNKGMDQTLREWYKEKEPWSNSLNSIPNEKFAVILADLFNNPKEFAKKYCWDDITEAGYIIEHIAKLCGCDPKCLLDFYKKERK